MPLEIPVSQSAYSSITVDLDQETFRIDLRWNSREEAWYMDVRQVDDTPIRIGVKVTPQAPINLPYHTEGMPRGVLQVLPERSTILRVGRYDFGTNAKLYYISPDEFAEITAAAAQVTQSTTPRIADVEPVPLSLSLISSTELALIFSEKVADVWTPLPAGVAIAVDSNVGAITPISSYIVGNMAIFNIDPIPPDDWSKIISLTYQAALGGLASTTGVKVGDFVIAYLPSGFYEAESDLDTLMNGTLASHLAA